MRYTVLVVVVGLAFACSDTKKSSKEEPSAAKIEHSGGAKVGIRGPLSDAEKESLRDCGKGVLLDSESSITSLDSRCETQNLANIVISEKYRLIRDSIVFDGAMWALVETKERDSALLRLVGGLDDTTRLDDAAVINLMLEGEAFEIPQEGRLVIERGELWVAGGVGKPGWLNVTEKGVGEFVPGPGPGWRAFRAGEQLWSVVANSTPAKVGLDYPYGKNDLGRLFQESDFQDVSGDKNAVFISLKDGESKNPQLVEIDNETAAVKRRIDVPILLNRIVVAHGYVWGLSMDEHKLFRVSIKSGEMEPLMTLTKPSDYFHGDLVADDTSVWVGYQGEAFDAGVIRFSPDAKPTGFAADLTRNVRTLYPHAENW